MKSSRTRVQIVSSAAVLFLLLSGCSPVATETEVPAAAATSEIGTATTESAAAAAEGSVFDASAVSTISIEVEESVLTQMIQTYLDTGDKEWIEATVTIDGQTFEKVGIKLKGNSSLRSITTDTPAEELPLRIRLDKYVDGQNLDGYSDFTVRSNSTQTALNEAVSLELLSEAGLASQQSTAIRFSVNGGEEKLRLVVQNLDDTWVEQNFPDAGADSVLYKSDADGNWSWRGEDGDYTTSFDIEAGADNYAPLIELLDLLNNGTDEEIAEKLPELVDLESFADYLAVQELINNFDDIDGPGNNSYLFWDSATGMFTVVAWDHNLTFGVSMGGGGGGGMPGGGGGRPGGGGGMPGGGEMPTDLPSDLPSDFAPPSDGQFPGGGEGGFPGGGGGGFGGMSNPLVEAFNANEEWSAMYESALTELRESLITSGTLTSIVDEWEATLTDGASGLVSAETISSEVDSIRAYAE